MEFTLRCLHTLMTHKGKVVKTFRLLMACHETLK